MRKIIFLAILTLALSTAAFAAAPPADRTHWSLEFKGGYFYPDIDNWKTYYGDDKTWQLAGSLAYKLRKQVDVGIEAGYIKDHGQGKGAISGTVTGNVTYELAPLNIFILFRGKFSETQWLVPYAGGGWTRMFYKEKIEAQSTMKGHADGYHGRAGLQFLLDETDSTASRNLLADYGIYHTYFFIETQYTRAMITDLDGASVNLGGTSYLMGFLFEF
jgi:opacity protein-like surface antigen